MQYHDYDNGSIEGYFGEFLEEYEQQVEEMLDRLPWGAIEACMDAEIREELHMEIAPCTDEWFLLVYMARHTEKYGDDFVIN